MAKRTYFCFECTLTRQKLVEDVDTVILCPCCFVAMKLKDPTISMVVKEIIDNGFQVRRVEQIANAGDLFQERADEATKKKNTDEL